jgi:DDE_Tnp_1-associated
VTQPGRAGDLLELLATVPDPRDPRGVRYPLAGVLAVAVTAVMAGARSFAAIG